MNAAQYRARADLRKRLGWGFDLSFPPAQPTITTRRNAAGQAELVHPDGTVAATLTAIDRPWTAEERAEADADERWEQYTDWLRDQQEPVDWCGDEPPF